MADLPEPNVLSIDTVLSDPASSNWLKEAIIAALDRDPVDAAKDAEILAVLLNNRANGILKHSIKTLGIN